jgi:hypothetical protein
MLEILEQDLNSDMSVIDKSLPNYDDKRGSVVACYNLKHKIFSGTYVHPSLLSFVILYANHNIMLDMSRFMIELFSAQTTRQQLSIDDLTANISSVPESIDAVHNDKILSYKHDLLQETNARTVARKEASKRKREDDKRKGIKHKKVVKQPKFTTDTVTINPVSTDDVDITLLSNTSVDGIINDINDDISKRNTVKTNGANGTKFKPISRRKNVSMSLITQALIIIKPVVQTASMQQIKFITCLLDDLKRYEKQIPKGWVIHTTFVNLRNLPTDLARRFNRDYEESIETDIQIDTNGEVMLLIDTLDSFDENIATFLADWMII